jgi:hypothetical protein
VAAATPIARAETAAERFHSHTQKDMSSGKQSPTLTTRCSKTGIVLGFDPVHGTVVSAMLGGSKIVGVAAGSGAASSDRSGVARTSGRQLWAGQMGGFVYQTVSVADYGAYGRLYGANFTSCEVPPQTVAEDTCQNRVKFCNGSSFVKVNMSSANPRHQVVFVQFSQNLSFGLNLECLAASSTIGRVAADHRCGATRLEPRVKAFQRWLLWLD